MGYHQGAAALRVRRCSTPDSRLNRRPFALVTAQPGRRALLAGKAERFGMGPAVMLGQRFAESAGPVGHGALADLAAGDRKLSDGDRETAGG